MSRLIEALQQNVWSSVRMHESAPTAAPAAATQEQAADSAAEGGAGMIIACYCIRKHCQIARPALGLTPSTGTGAIKGKAECRIGGSER